MEIINALDMFVSPEEKNIKSVTFKSGESVVLQLNVDKIESAYIDSSVVEIRFILDDETREVTKQIKTITNHKYEDLKIETVLPNKIKITQEVQDTLNTSYTILRSDLLVTVHIKASGEPCCTSVVAHNNNSYLSREQQGATNEYH